MTTIETDKRQIHDVLIRYCRGVDRLDASLIGSTFHSDAQIDLGSFKTIGAEVADVITRTVPTISERSLHYLSNVSIEVDGDRAYSESYVRGLLLFRRNEDRYVRELVCRYVDRFERRDGEWRIGNRVAVYEWSRIDRLSEEWPAGPQFVQSLRSRDDVSYDRGSPG